MEKKKIYMIYSDMKLQNLNVQGKLCADSNKLQEWKTWCSIFVKKKIEDIKFEGFFLFVHAKNMHGYSHACTQKYAWLLSLSKFELICCGE